VTVPTIGSANVPQSVDRTTATPRGVLATVGLLAVALFGLLAPVATGATLLVAVGTATVVRGAPRLVSDRTGRREPGPAVPSGGSEPTPSRSA